MRIYMRKLSKYMIFMLICASSVEALGACNTPELLEDLLSAFQINSRPLDWQSVRPNSLEANKAFPVVVEPTYRLSTSTVIFRGEKHSLKNISVCPHRTGLELTKEGLGTVYVSRKNSDLASAFVSIQEKNTRIRVLLRPKRFVN